ncbi:MAG: DUF2852 domain-containing protein [Alphaproteobacteria bacterium]|nr:DUF2852 domain-containing protein [Alphaproteobacteria bacterium]
MTLAARLDDLGNPAWIALTVVGFLIWWPLGLVALGYLVGSGRLARWTGCGARGWHNHTHAQSNPCGWWSVRSNSSGNRAFDEYRTATLRRLEEEQREFKEFLNRLRHAKDKAEFDQFMAERGHRPQGPTPQPEN